MYRKSAIIYLFIFSITAALLVGCTLPTATVEPELSSWSEQYTAAKELVEDLGNEIFLEDADAVPFREQPDASGESIELHVYLVFKSLEQIEDDVLGKSYNTDIVKYNDHRLAATIQNRGIAPHISYPDPVAIARQTMMQIGPQEALQATIVEGEAYMGRPVDYGNIWIDLSWDLSDAYPPMDDILAPAWEVTYYLDKQNWLHCRVNAQSGEVVGCVEDSL